MLLLLRGDPPINPGVVFSTQSGILFKNVGVGVTFSTVTGFGPFDSLELNVGVNFDAHLGFAATGHATTGPGVTFAMQTDLLARGGYSGTVTFANSIDSGWTVGNTFQGDVIFATTLGFTGDLRAIPSATFALSSDFKPGIPDVSGGTVTPGVSFALVTSFNASAVVSSSVTFNCETDLQGTGFPERVGFATQMRLSFSADQIRLFFRKG